MPVTATCISLKDHNLQGIKLQKHFTVVRRWALSELKVSDEHNVWKRLWERNLVLGSPIISWIDENTAKEGLSSDLINIDQVTNLKKKSSYFLSEFVSKRILLSYHNPVIFWSVALWLFPFHENQYRALWLLLKNYWKHASGYHGPPEGSVSWRLPVLFSGARGKQI